MTTKKPYFIVISGPNGAGKSTLHKYILAENPFLSGASFINFDIEFARLKALPEYATQYKTINQETDKSLNKVIYNTTNTFKKQMQKFGIDLHKLITLSAEDKKQYYKQYVTFARIPQKWEHIADKIYSKSDLAANICDKNIHNRINAKINGNNWYPIYKELIHNPGIQKAIIKNKANQDIENLNHFLTGTATKNLRIQINQAFANKHNMIYETTCNATRLKKQAKQNEYDIYTIYMCIAHPTINISRVQQRVQKGGHDVPQQLILQRYSNFMKHLSKNISSEQTAIVIDNSHTKAFMPIFIIHNGNNIEITQCPEFLKNTYTEIQNKFKQKTINEFLDLPQNTDIKKLTDEQRKIFGQIAITKLLTSIDTPQNPDTLSGLVAHTSQNQH